MTPAQRFALIAAAVVVLVGGFLVARGGDDKSTSTSTGSAVSTTLGTASAPSVTPATGTTPATVTTAPAPAPAVPAIVVTGGKPDGGIQKIEVAKGDEVRFTVRSDVADEIHVHGYDLMKDVAKGGSVSFAFPAKIDGIFEVELENAGVQIAELRVSP
ncbi:MAG: hypothetical protein JWM31_1021 [Solirubrobacterales bacterium]|nr:hypothetical protein [Solirubrobacterales bacterium]